MSDFINDIEARRESGMTDEEIFAELGTPKQAAAELNAQMADYTYRKSPWRYLFAVCAVYGAVKLLSGIWVNIVWLLFQWRTNYSRNAASIGIIGGADGPTAIFVTTPVWVHYLMPVVLLIVGIWGFIRLSRCKKKQH